MSGLPGERAVLFGKNHGLVGIVTQPAGAAAARGPAVIVLNTGIIHRVGHHRMFVAMSRVLAQSGYQVLRFDLAGIGDSETKSDALPLVQSALADIGDAVDLLAQDNDGVRVVLVGLCSGADHAVLYGHTDPRVQGVVLIDPSIPPTTRFYFHYIASRITRLRNWMSVLAGRSGVTRIALRHVAHAVGAAGAPGDLTLDNLQFHPQLEQSYRASVANGLHILAILTGESTRQSYREQILDAFPQVPFGGQLALEFFGDSDHTFSAEADRARLTQLILDWTDGVSRAPGAAPLVAHATVAPPASE